VQPTDAVWLSAAIGNWRKLAVAGGAMLALLGAWPITASHLTNPVPRLGLTFEMPAGQAGWSRLDAPLTEWRPELTGALIQKTVTYDKGGRKVGAFVGLYRDQRQGAELVNSMNQLVSTINREWILLDSGRHDVALGGAPTTVRTATLHGIGGSIVAWRWYWLGDSMTVSDARAKLDLAFDRLHGRDDTSAWVTLYVVNPADAGDAERVLEDFAAAMGGPLTSALQSARLP
jgi:EpsI family protein